MTQSSTWTALFFLVSYWAKVKERYIVIIRHIIRLCTSFSLTCANSRTASKKFSLKKFRENVSRMTSQISMNNNLSRQLLLLPHSERETERDWGGGGGGEGGRERAMHDVQYNSLLYYLILSYTV